MRLHVFPPSPRAFKVLAVAHHLGIDYQLALCDLTKGEHKSAAYAALNPNQRMPTLEDGCLVAPKGPGLGLELDEAAVQRYRVH